jgi:hypothetical protein
MKANTIVSNPQSELWWFNVLEPHNISSDQPSHGMQDPNRRPLFDSTKLSLRLITRDNPLAHFLTAHRIGVERRTSHALKILQGQAVLG